MNNAFCAYTLSGRTLDIGGGRNPDYFSYLKNAEGVAIEALDGSMSGIDFEKDALPHGDASIDTVVLANVLEHIYDHQFLLKEIRRVLRPGGQLIGFVPFWIGYHADPHDYFRYTHEALTRMLADAGFVKATVAALPGGPLSANFNTIVLSLPRFARPLAYLWYAPFDRLYVRLRPHSAGRNPLGYTFTATAP
jgi:SAM-dependent methyltransferase